MKRLTERNLVVVMFIVVIVMFYFAQNATQELEQAYMITAKRAAASVTSVAQHIVLQNQQPPMP